MSDISIKNRVTEIFSRVDIKINGTRPWDIKIHNENFYKRVLAQGSLGFGESYMDGWWDAEELDHFFYKLLSDPSIWKEPDLDFGTLLTIVKSKILNMQDRNRSNKVAKEHYDLGNDFYEKMLDKRMLYTCAYWKDTHNLQQAQENKLDVICKKIMLKPKETVLDLGCGFGSFAKYAAEKYGCSVNAYNISKEQLKWARESCKGLPVTYHENDYREAQGVFDKVVAIGLTEHVGYKNYKTLMKTVERCLKPGGLFLLHTIGLNESTTCAEPWFDKYIFPNGMLPSVKQLAEAAEGVFVMEDWHNLNVDYDKTLVAWYQNFDKHWPEFKQKYGERFYRMWKYYLLSLAGSFRARGTQLWQVVFSKGGYPGGYQSVR